MAPTICAPFRFISADRSFIARWINGQTWATTDRDRSWQIDSYPMLSPQDALSCPETRERDGASMWCTKDVAKSLSRTSRVMCSNLRFHLVYLGLTSQVGKTGFPRLCQCVTPSWIASQYITMLQDILPISAEVLLRLNPSLGFAQGGPYSHTTHRCTCRFP